MIFLHEIESNLNANYKGGYYKDAKLYIAVNDSYIVQELSSTLIDGYFCFAGVEQIVRSYMQLNNLTVVNLQCSVIKYKADAGAGSETDDIDLVVLYTTGAVRGYRSVTADDIANTQFLNQTKCAFLYKHNQMFLNYFINPNVYSSEVYTITTYYRDGRITNDGMSISSGLGSKPYAYKADVAKYEISLGSRKYTIYMMDDTPCEELSFRNFYNASESIFLPAAVTRNPSTEYETARLNHIATLYDIEHKEEFTLVTTPLHPTIADKLLWMVRSRQLVYKLKENGISFNVDILIKDYKLSRSSEPNTPIVFEMTFEYADTRLPSTLTL